jgi:hypothetical protein
MEADTTRTELLLGEALRRHQAALANLGMLFHRRRSLV